MIDRDGTHFSVQAMVFGYHYYKAIWDAAIDREFSVGSFWWKSLDKKILAIFYKLTKFTQVFSHQYFLLYGILEYF